MATNIKHAQVNLYRDLKKESIDFFARNYWNLINSRMKTTEYNPVTIPNKAKAIKSQLTRLIVSNYILLYTVIKSSLFYK